MCAWEGGITDAQESGGLGDVYKGPTLGTSQNKSFIGLGLVVLNDFKLPNVISVHKSQVL